MLLLEGKGRMKANNTPLPREFPRRRRKPQKGECNVAEPAATTRRHIRKNMTQIKADDICLWMLIRWDMSYHPTAREAGLGFVLAQILVLIIRMSSRPG